MYSILKSSDLSCFSCQNYRKNANCEQELSFNLKLNTGRDRFALFRFILSRLAAPVLQQLPSPPHRQPPSASPHPSFQPFQSSLQSLVAPFLSPSTVCLLLSLSPPISRTDGRRSPSRPPSTVTLSLSLVSQEREGDTIRNLELPASAHAGRFGDLSPDSLFTLNEANKIYIWMIFLTFNILFYTYVVKTAQINSMHKQ